MPPNPTKAGQIFNFPVKSCPDMPNSQTAKATGIFLATLAVGVPGMGLMEKDHG
jgi:hypothetical protein